MNTLLVWQKNSQRAAAKTLYSKVRIYIALNSCVDNIVSSDLIKVKLVKNAHIEIDKNIATNCCTVFENYRRHSVYVGELSARS